MHIWRSGKKEPTQYEMQITWTITNNCEYCIKSHSLAARKKGATDGMINEMIAIVGMANETNRLVEGYQVEVDDFLK